MAEGPINSGDKVKITGTYVDPSGQNQAITIDGTIVSTELPERPPDAGPKGTK
jgi:hypothetical protein